MHSNITENIEKIRDVIAEEAVRSGRSPGDIRLVAAAKTRTAPEIQQAVAGGICAVGENRVQEMCLKNKEGAYRGASLHFIGNLQSNKISKVVGVCDLIESVGSAALLESIGKKALSLGIVQDILIEVNVGRESQKAGILPEQTEEILEFASVNKGVNVLGLMAIPPFYEEKARNCYYFDIMFKLFVDMSKKKYDNVSVQLLSMGMSGSYADAIRAGSNMVRIGTAIFGER